jgi:hypothetical protein
MDFLYRGGTKKHPHPDNLSSIIVIKFFAFVFSEGKEMHLFDAERKGFVTKTTELNYHSSLRGSNEIKLPSEITSAFGLDGAYSIQGRDMSFVLNTSAKIMKVFTSVSGFGIRKVNKAFYFRLDENSSKEVYVTNTLPSVLGRVGRTDPVNYLPFGFYARGDRLSDKEVQDLFGANSPEYTFYSRSTELPTAEIDKFYCCRLSEEYTRSQRVRRLRIRR